MHAVAAGPQLDVQAVVLPEELGRFRRVDQLDLQHGVCVPVASLGILAPGTQAR